MTGSRWQGVAIASGVAFTGFSAAHLIDEFVWGAPGEFHLSESTTELLALAYMLALAGLVAQASRGRRGGYLGLAVAGGLIFAADVIKHGVEIVTADVWRFGLISVGLAAGLMISSLMTVIASVQALRSGAGD